MSDAFDIAFKQVVGLEGNYSCDPSDGGNWTGGKENSGQLVGTMFGISAASYPKLDIASLDLAKAKSIYQNDFWDRLKCDTLPDPVAIALFSMAVNLGCSGAAKALQRALKLNDDGVIGNLTIGTATSLPPNEVLERFLTECAWDYTQLAQFDTYGKGWLSRVIQVAVNAVVA